MAARQPTRMALKVPRGRTRAGDIDYLALTFAELATEVDAWATRIISAGVRPGDRTLVMVRQGLPLIASTFALFQVGAVPVVIDPGMGLRSFLGCVQRSRPRALVGIPLARVVSRLFPRAFRSVAARVPASNTLTARLSSPNSQPSTFNSQPPPLNSQPAQSAPTDLAAILFTSGSTGAPKGVCYEHGMFEAQVGIIRDTYAIEPGEIDLPLLPIFALFNPALGLTTIVPEIDPRRPAAMDPARIVQAIRQEGVTNSFGSPTLWKKIGQHCLTHRISLPGLRRVLCAGAPVPTELWSSSREWMPNGRLHSPYGATEVLPVSSVSSDEILVLDAHAAVSAARVAEGACVGRPVGGAQVKIIALTDTPIASLTDARELPPGRIGEIIVSGPTVTRAYADNPVATAAAKIAAVQPDGAPAVFHRMGDCGYLDPQGRLWFCGRKAERVETAHGPLFTEPCERVFRSHPRVHRCALIGFGERGHQRPALVVEVNTRNSHERRALAHELRELARAHSHTESINVFYFRPRFPVDVRHNAKIHRLALARWAATAHGYLSDPKR
ncbi:AMP-dependent synthetase and ligase [Opitutus terrae PB90-1]|uniref:AMP-dependent synthetase and ligase n=2 Tax=Opitutus terrae TaxID=107709 RepID=B1ZWL9_OPITP|nr:AMP-dependent synthetase and ligase [Opitutus terrae PB90-1]